MRIGRWIVRPLFAWYDLWIGAYYDRARGILYILPLPCVGITIERLPGWRRDPDNDCAEYTPGVSGLGDCQGDGHYLCETCIYHEEPEDEDDE